MSSHRLFPIVRAALVAASSVTLLACASGRAKEAEPLPSRPPSDPSVVTSADGRSVEDLFFNRFPGVTVTRAPNGGLQIRVRGGSNTFYGSDEPLYVVDDVPLAPDARGVVFLNPNDIARIEVLKNPADIAIYGVRAANGVVKVTTKQSGRRP